MPPSTALHCVIDIEASGFGTQSYPIEIGWVLADGRSGCMLVRPADGWTHWDASAERIHGITRDTLLRHGQPARLVAERLNAELAGHTVYCDAWGHDYPWLARLFEEAGLAPRFKLEPAARLLGDTQLGQLDEVHAEAFAELEVQRHRASNDARALQRALGKLQR
jgi:DNA polymerase III epsilon subunit-like protein